MTKVNFSRVFIAVIMALLVIVVSCENKPIDKSKYEIIDLKEARLQINLAELDENANGTKMFAAHAKYCDVSETIRVFLGVRKGQVVFGEPETDVTTGSYVNLSAFNLKGKMPNIENGQLATIYFRLERKKGRIHKLEIDLIEEVANMETVRSMSKAKLNIDAQQATFSLVDVNSDEQLSYNKIIIDGNEVIDTKTLSIFYSNEIVNGVEFICKVGEIEKEGNTVYTEKNELNYKLENGILTILGITE